MTVLGLFAKAHKWAAPPDAQARFCERGESYKADKRKKEKGMSRRRGSGTSQTNISDFTSVESLFDESQGYSKKTIAAQASAVRDAESGIFPLQATATRDYFPLDEGELELSKG